MDVAQRIPKFDSHLFKITNVMFLIFLAYASWYGADTLGSRIELKELPIKGITTHGLINLVAILIMSAGLLILLIPSYLTRSPSKSEYFVSSWFALNLLNWPDSFHKDYLIGLENSLFLTLLALAAIRREEFTKKLKYFFRYSPWLETLAYAAALSLPFLIDLGGDGYSIWKKQGVVFRFAGWLSLATYIGFLGLSVLMTGAITLYYRQKQKLYYYLGLFMMVLGYLGIQLSVHRISLWGATCFLLVAALVSKRNHDYKHFKIFLLAGYLCFLSQFVGSMGQKNMFFTSDPSEQEVTMDNFDNFIQTNGRTNLLKHIVTEIEHNPLLGLGTGGTAHYVKGLSSIGVQGGQPHSDFLRIYGDHGVLGLLIFSIVSLILFFQLWGSLACGVLLAIGVSMATDNLMVFPIWGYGPMFLATLLAVKQDE